MIFVHSLDPAGPLRHHQHHGSPLPPDQDEQVEQDDQDGQDGPAEEPGNPRAEGHG